MGYERVDSTFYGRRKCGVESPVFWYLKPLTKTHLDRTGSNRSCTDGQAKSTDTSLFIFGTQVRLTNLH